MKSKVRDKIEKKNPIKKMIQNKTNSNQKNEDQI
jgi:hypothetical protein